MTSVPVQKPAQAGYLPPQLDRIEPEQERAGKPTDRDFAAQLEEAEEGHGHESSAEQEALPTDLADKAAERAWTTDLAVSDRRALSDPQIGSNAVAFQARGIVGPTAQSAMPNPPTPAIDSAQTGSANSASPQPALQSGAPVEPGSHELWSRAFLHVQTPPLARPSTNGKVGNTGSARPAATSAPASLSRPVQQTTHVSTPIARSAAIIAEAAKANQTARPSPIHSLSHFQATTPLAAQFVATHKDYRLIIRSEELSDGIAQQILSHVRAALAELSLPQRPIELIQPEREV